MGVSCLERNRKGKRDKKTLEKRRITNSTLICDLNFFNNFNNKEYSQLTEVSVDSLEKIVINNFNSCAESFFMIDTEKLEKIRKNYNKN